MTDISDIKKLVKHRDEMRAEVHAWMKDQGAKGKLRHNGDSPAWLAYACAERDLDAAVSALGKSHNDNKLDPFTLTNVE